MPRLAAAVSTLRLSAQDLRRRVRNAAPEVLQRIHRPRKLERVADGATRAGQIVSLLFVGPLIVVSLALIVAFNALMASVFSGGDWQPGDPQQDLFAWLITAITLGTFILAAWTWFQFVRTAGFGWFSYDD